jgi:hypothetical protein
MDKPDHAVEAKLREAGDKLATRPLPPELRDRLLAIPARRRPRPATPRRLAAALGSAAMAAAVVIAVVAGFSLHGTRRAAAPAWQPAARLLLGGGPGDAVAPGPDGAWILARNTTELYHATARGGLRLVARPDVAANNGLPGNRSALLVSGGQVWMSEPTHLLRWDAGSGALLGSVAVSGVGSPHGLAVADGRVWAASADTGRVVAIDARTAAIVSSTVVVAADAAVEDPEGVVALGGDVYATLPPERRIVRIDAATGRVLAEFSVGHDIADVVAGFGSLWVASTADGLLLRLDPQTGAVQASLRVPEPLALGADDDGVWVASNLGSALLVSARSNAVASVVDLSAPPAFGVSASGHEVWIAYGQEATLVRLVQR